MEMIRLSLLAAFLATASAKPVAFPDGPGSDRLPYNPGGPLIQATGDNSAPTPLSYQPGGELIPASALGGSVVSDTPIPGGILVPGQRRDETASVSPGGPMIPVTGLPSTITPLPYIPGGPMTPDPYVPGGPMTPDPVNPGGPMTPDPSNPGGPMTPDPSNPGGAMSPDPSNPGGPMTPDPTVSGGGLEPPNRRGETALAPEPTTTQRRGRPTAPIELCTSTMKLAGDYSVACRWDGTLTAYPSTTTLYQPVNCHGCKYISVEGDYFNCPIQEIHAITTVKTQKTEWSMSCEPLTALSQLFDTDTTTPTTAAAVVSAETITGLLTTGWPVPTPKVTPKPRQIADVAAACPTTYVVQPHQTAGGVSTQYQRLVTQTQKVPCGGCQLVVSTAMAGYGPPAKFTSTTTLPVGTTTVYGCQ